MLSFIKFWGTISKMPSLENTGFRCFFPLAQQLFYIFTLNISRTVLQSLLTIPFFEKYLSSAFKYMPKLWVIFCCHQKTRQRTLFFSSTLWALSVGIIHFSISRPSKLNSMRSPPLYVIFWYVKYLFKPVRMISFFFRKLVNFWYITCFPPNLIPIWPWSHGIIYWYLTDLASCTFQPISWS